MRNGGVFCTFLKECVDALNSGRFPRMKNTWEYIVKEENQKLIDRLLENYSKSFSNLSKEELNKRG